jgi:4,5-dihydroxyphthalate decarboxylase
MLLASELDALMIPYPPKGFYDPDSPVVRLIPDFRTAEREYAARVGYYPAHHIIALKRDVFEQHPWVADRLLQAFSESLRAWEQSRLLLAETSPWLLADLEETVALFGNHWQDHGLEHNRAMIAALCEEEFAQKLVEQPIDPSAVFAEYEETGGR